MCIYTCQILFIHSPVDEHLGCFHILPIVRSAAMNTDVQVCIQVLVCNSFGNLPLSRTAGSYGHSVKLFEKPQIVFQSIPTSNVRGFQFLHILPNACYFLFLFVCVFVFYYSHPSRHASWFIFWWAFSIILIFWGEN